MKKIYIANVGNSSNELKQSVINHLSNYQVIDINQIHSDKVGLKVAENVLKDLSSVGIIMCGNGFGIAKEASIHDDITVINCIREDQVISGKKINNANILSLGARMITIEEGLALVDTFLAD